MKKDVLHPCQGCVYFKACGSTSRREPCQGRKTKRQQQREQAQEERKK